MQEEIQQNKLQELQLLQHQLQAILMQKQTFQIEQDEIKSTLNELKNSSGDAYKLSGGVMFKSSKEILVKELEEKSNLLSLRITSLDKQEKIIEDKADKIREEFSQNKNKTK